MRRGLPLCILVPPGGGITARNVKRIVNESGVKEFHCSARSGVMSAMEYQNSHVSMGGALRSAEFERKVTSREKVQGILNAATSVGE